MKEGGEVSRRRFLQNAALSGAAAVAGGGVATRAAGEESRRAIGAGQAVDPRSAEASAKVKNPIVPNFAGEYGGNVPDFQAPKRPME